MSFASVQANDKTNQNVFFLIIMLKSFYVEPAIKRKQNDSTFKYPDFDEIAHWLRM